MKKLFKKTKGLIKGTPVAVLVSIALHGLLLLAAVGFVVFKIVDRQPQQFVPVQKIDRPKLKLKKLQIKVKPTSKPKQSTERIVTKVTRSMPEIQLPEMSGVGSGDIGGGDIGGFDIMEDLSKVTLMGGGKSLGNDLVGTYYYLQQSRGGTPTQISHAGGAYSGGGADGPLVPLLKEFFEKGWDPRVFDPYWRSPTKLYATQIFIPPVTSALAPDKFGDTRRVEAAFWVAHYVGKIAHPTGGRFRFWGFADDLLYVRINGEVVLDACWESSRTQKLSGWARSDKDDQKYQLAHGRFRVGDWFELKPEEPVDMEVLIGEVPGGGFCAMLCVQEEGVEYPERDFGGPLLPIFRTAPTPPHLVDEMSYTLPEGHVDFTNGPVFSVY